MSTKHKVPSTVTVVDPYNYVSTEGDGRAGLRLHEGLKQHMIWVLVNINKLTPVVGTNELYERSERIKELLKNLTI